MTRKNAFTLIELMAVVAIMGILAAAAVLSLAYTVDKQRKASMSQNLEEADALVRSAARQGGQSQTLTFDLDRQKVLWQPAGQSEPTELAHLPADAHLRVERQMYSSGQAAITISPSGWSQSYALDLEISGQDRWMMVAGLTGRVFWTNDARQMEAIFQSLSAVHSPSGDDAD